MSLERDFRNSELGSEAYLNILLSSNTSPSLLMKSLNVLGEAHGQDVRDLVSSLTGSLLAEMTGGIPVLAEWSGQE